ncbi:hypothetical protein [Clostridium botulinum]|uniref:hypothetical protein n=1 Tax=Clostridium botulinum TaxID=1491 RepID=UPI001C9A6046|nr:hypothetical protein [Clostridium botulinum]MBY6838632.1 hypothetical protein [Clostridium botulinum]
MKYIKFSLDDEIPVKFKIRRLYPYGLDIAWKYTSKLNFTKYIKLHYSSLYSKVQYLEQLSDNELIDKYKHLIQEEHCIIKKEKYNIKTN